MGAASTMITTTITTTEPRVIVSGSVRSGTSLVMRILDHAGVPVLHDTRKQPNVHNPHGYYETRLAHRLRRGDTGWLEQAAGHAVKILPAPMLRRLPETMRLRVVWMARPVEEVASSYYTMIKDAPPDHRIRSIFDLSSREAFVDHFSGAVRRNTERTRAWLEDHPNCEVLDVEFHALIRDPAPSIARVLEFVGGTDHCSAWNLAGLVDPDLWRHRASAGHGPGVMRKSANFAAAVAKAGKAIWDGAPPKKASAVAARRRICAACEYLDTDARTCSLCGCPVRRKTAWRSESCPDGRW